jgi:replicative DNA helicase
MSVQSRQPQRSREGRVPPHDLEAEAAVLSSCMLDKAALDTVRGLIAPEHCYADANRRILEAVFALDDAGHPVDVVTVATKLREQNRLEQSGGTVYLASITDATPAVAHVDHHAKTVRDLWRVRQAIALHQTKAAEGFFGIESVQEWLEQTETALSGIGSVGYGTELEGIGTIAARYYQSMVAAKQRGQAILGTATGFTDLDERTGGLFDGDLTIVAARPGLGKTSLATALARNVAGSGEGVAFFSLEMPRDQIAMRMLCAEEYLDANRIRRGQLSADDWSRLMRGTTTLASLPIWVDDTPAITVQELRAKVRRLQRQILQAPTEHCRKLGLVAVDYLQLMKGIREKGDTREREVASLSQGLKNLAKQLRLPVVALSQLNRSVEKKGSDKRPQLSDLRECIPGDARVLLANGQRVRMDTLVGSERSVVCLDPGALKLTARRARFVEAGQKEVWRVRLRSGRSFRASFDHPVLTLQGWKPLNQLHHHEEIAVPRGYRLTGTRVMAPELARLLGYLVSNGSYKRLRSVGVTLPEPELRQDAQTIAQTYLGVRCREHKHWSGTHSIELTNVARGPGGNAAINWLRELGIHGHATPEKRTPEILFGADSVVLGQYIAGLYAGDGSVVRRRRGGWTIKYVSTSMELLREIQHLLLRLGVMAVLGKPTRHTKSTVDIAELRISDKANVLAFARAVPIPGKKGKRLQRAAAESQGRTNEHHDRLPNVVERALRVFMLARGIRYRDAGYICQRKRINRQALGALAHKLTALGHDGEETRHWAMLAESDVLWDAVESVQREGVEPVYDATVDAAANFIVDDVIVHNSGAIENDADSVWLLYRDSYYHRDAGPEVELDVAKQRNGPTGVVKLMFRGKNMRYDNAELADDYGVATGANEWDANV